MHTLDSVAETLAKEFSLTAAQQSEVFDHIRREDVQPHVCHHALMVAIDMKARGRQIDNPIGLFINLTRKYRNVDPNTHSPKHGTSSSHEPKANAFVGKEYDFWMDGDKALRDDICERIIHGFESDDFDTETPYSRAEAVKLFKQCAPEVPESMFQRILELATDRTGIIVGSYARRLATATRIITKNLIRD